MSDTFAIRLDKAEFIGAVWWLLRLFGERMIHFTRDFYGVGLIKFAVTLRICYGFLALAVLIFGAWRPLKILLGALLFGLMSTIAVSSSVIFFLAPLGIPTNFYRMLPFLATLIVLAFTSKKTAAPRAAGQPYDKGSR